MTQTIEQLQARVRELEWENVKLKAESRDACFGLNDYYGRKLAAEQEENGRLENQVLARDAELRGRTQEILGLKEQLAAEQLNNKLLREALEAVIKVHGYESGIPVEAISTPASSEALDQYVAEKVREAGKFDIWKTNPYTKVLETSIKQLTKQRDLAVEALENCRLLAARHRKEEWAGHIMRFCKDAGLSGSPIRNDSIKESENNKAS